MSTLDLDERAQRIVDTAVALAERDGFAAVRLRDVAATANVALGTVYKRFASKEAILIAALEQSAERMMDGLGRAVTPGDTPAARVVHLFKVVTRGMTRKPNLSRALMRAIASGDPNITERVASFHAMMTALTIAAIRGECAAEMSEWGGDVDEDEREVAQLMQQVWFAALVSWAGGLFEVDVVLFQIESAAKRLML